jgi:hypothetical protein
MNEKTLTSRDLAQIKRIAMNVDADYQAVCKLNEKIAELTKKRDNLQIGIDEMEAPVIRKTGGYKSTDLYKKIVVPQFNADGTPKTDKEGRQLKSTKYVLRYGDSIFPCEATNENIVEEPVGSDNEQPVSAVEDAGNIPQPIEVVSGDVESGSDFDEDKSNVADDIFNNVL